VSRILYDFLKKVKQVNRHSEQRYLISVASLGKIVSISVGNIVYYRIIWSIG